MTSRPPRTVDLNDERPGRPGSAGLPRAWAIVGTQLLVLAIAGSMIHVPVHSVSPGQTHDVLADITIRGAPTHPSDGSLLLTTASVSQAPLTLWEALYVWLDPGIATIPRAYLVPPGSSDADESVKNRHDIEESKIVAAVAAFRALGLEVPELDGVSIVTIIEGMPAEGVLKPGDRVTSIDGRPIADSTGFSRQIRQGSERITVGFERRGRAREVELEPAQVDGRPFLGVTLGTPYRLPNDVRIDSGNVVGPSGGLVFALSIADAFTREDLTRGYTIGVTGLIELDERGRGVVGEIGAVGEKVRGAYRDGATVFVVPQAEAEEAMIAAPAGMEVIGVRTLRQAIDALRALPDAA